MALLQEDGRTSFAEMSRTLGAPEASVRRMVRRLIDEHLIVITAVANPRLVGLDAMAWIALRIDWGRLHELPSEILQIRGIDYVATTTGTFQVFAEIGARDATELADRIRQVRSLPGVRATETFYYLDLYHQEFNWVGPGSRGSSGGGGDRDRPVGELELDLILALRQDGRRSFRRLAQDLSTSERRVRRAYAALTESDAVRVIAVVNPARMGLAAMALLGTRLTPSVPMERIAAAVATEPRVDYLTICTGRYDFLIEVACRDHEELVAVVERLESIEGVDDIEVFSYLRLQYRDESVWSAGRVSALEENNRAGG